MEDDMEDEEFTRRLQEKIERLTEISVDLRVDRDDPAELQVEFQQQVPQVVIGSNIYEYPGFGRMCVEYTVASIREQRAIEPLEFHLLLARN